MACRACQQQRGKVGHAFKVGDYRRAVVESYTGVGMVLGVVSKDSAKRTDGKGK